MNSAYSSRTKSTPCDSQRPPIRTHTRYSSFSNESSSSSSSSSSSPRIDASTPASTASSVSHRIFTTTRSPSSTSPRRAIWETCRRTSTSGGGTYGVHRPGSSRRPQNIARRVQARRRAAAAAGPPAPRDFVCVASAPRDFVCVAPARSTRGCCSSVVVWANSLYDVFSRAFNIQTIPIGTARRDDRVDARARPHARAPDIENTSPPRFDAIMTEAPSALLERTNLAEYLRARKAIALENSQQGP